MLSEIQISSGISRINHILLLIADTRMKSGKHFLQAGNGMSVIYNRMEPQSLLTYVSLFVNINMYKFRIVSVSF